MLFINYSVLALKIKLITCNQQILKASCSNSYYVLSYCFCSFCLNIKSLSIASHYCMEISDWILLLTLCCSW